MSRSEFSRQSDSLAASSIARRASGGRPKVSLNGSSAGSSRFIRTPATALLGLSGFLWLSSLLGSSAGADVFQVDEFNVRWQRSVGLPNFENPRTQLARIRTAVVEYKKAVGGNDSIGLLAPMPITVLSDRARLGAVVFADAAKEQEVKDDPSKILQCVASDFADADMVAPEALGGAVDGVYKSAVSYLLLRVEALKAGINEDPTLSAALADFEAGLREFETRERTLEDNAFAMRFFVGEQDIVWFADSREKTEGERAVGGREETLRLPPLTAGIAGRGLRIDTESLGGLASQFEKTLEENFFLNSGGQRVNLDFKVAAQTRGTGSGSVDLIVAFVGPADRPAIPVRNFSILYRGGDGSVLKLGVPEVDAQATPGSAEFDLPDPREVLAATKIRLYRVGEGDKSFLTDWAPGAPADSAVDMSLDTVFSKPEMFSIGALQSVFESVVATLQASEDESGLWGGDLIGVFADADEGQLDLSRGCLDTRDPEKSKDEFRIKVIPGIVNTVRAVAAGERVDPEERINPPFYRFDRLLLNAPFQPGSAQPQVLRESELRDYLDRQSRHPNRRVDAAITAAEAATGASGQPADGRPAWNTQGTVGVDFLVTENKPWSVLVQGSNTGVESTGEWQIRTGFFHSDVFGNDEIFSLEYVTTETLDSNTVTSYFDAPVGESDYLRWKVFAGWSQFTASEIGILNATFEGESPSFGGEIAWNIGQWGKTFLDLVGGVTWTNIQVSNSISGQTGNLDFLIPTVGLRLQRNNRDATTDFSINLDYGTSGGASQVELNKLGRLLPEESWQAVRFDFTQSFYLDPLFQNKADVENATLAHELYFRVRGQNSLGNRLVPQFMGTAGGFFTVRGYPTSLLAGDNVYLMTGEYRLHLPQILGFEESPQPFLGLGTEPFRLRPQFGYGPTDWDLILRGFVDAGVVQNVDRLSFETDENLIGVGGGVELQLYKGLGYPTLRNISLRLDVGIPIQKPDFTDIDGYQMTFVGTLSF